MKSFSVINKIKLKKNESPVNELAIKYKNRI